MQPLEAITRSDQSNPIEMTLTIPLETSSSFDIHLYTDRLKIV